MAFHRAHDDPFTMVLFHTAYPKQCGIATLDGDRILRVAGAPVADDYTDWPTLDRLLRLGLPIGASVFVEGSLFATVALLMCTLGATAAAAMMVTMGIAFGDRVETEISRNGDVKYSAVLPYCRTFSDVPEDEELIYNNEIGNFAIATNLRSFVEKFPAVGTGTEWRVRFRKAGA